jgi:hypothetical protein
MVTPIGAGRQPTLSRRIRPLGPSFPLPSWIQVTDWVNWAGHRWMGVFLLIFPSGP